MGVVGESRVRWLEADILETVQALDAAGEDLSYTGLQANGYAGMYAAARKAFGSWKNTLKEAKVDLSKGSRRHAERRWTKNLCND